MPFAVGASAGLLFTVPFTSSASPPFHVALATVMLVGAFLTGGIGSLWMGSGAGVKYLEFWELPTWKPLRWLMQVIGGMAFAVIWDLGLFMVVRSLS